MVFLSKNTTLDRLSPALLQLTVAVDRGSYPVLIGEGLLGHPACLTPYIRGKQVAVVTNETVAPLYLDRLAHTLHDYQLTSIVLPDGESYKTLATIDRIVTALLQAKYTRQATLIALGGGVIGDLTGFAAACYQRGIDYIHVPTTLLAQVDAAIGGKTGVNHPLGKNMLGAFHQPNAVVIDMTTLKTLPDRLFVAGLAEVTKYGLMNDAPFYAWLQAHIDALLTRQTTALSYAIQRSCINKIRIVAADEKESGVRAMLNLGHTFGHAIEAFTEYRHWLHGEAVAVGIVMAADLSARLGRIKPSHVNDIIMLFKQFGLPVSPPAGMLPEHFLGLMATDKKVMDGQLRLVLLQSVGQAVVSSAFDHTVLADSLHALCNQ